MPLNRSIRSLLILVFTLSAVLAGCAGLQNKDDLPVVSISSFKAIPGDGVVPRFEIGLHIVNPSRDPLELKGIAYTISIEGHKILTGVSNKLPRIDPYAEADVLLMSGVDLLSSLSFLSDLTRRGGKQALDYRLEAKLDAGTLLPPVRVTRTGKLTLTPER